MYYDPLNTPPYQTRRTTALILKQWMQSKTTTLWVNDTKGLSYDETSIATMPEAIHTTPGIHHHEGQCLFTSASEGCFVLYKSPGVAHQVDQKAFRQDPISQCTYYLAQNTRDNALWKLVRVDSHTEPHALAKNEKLVLSLLDKEETYSLADHDYMLMPMPGIPLTELWGKKDLPFRTPKDLFDLIRSALETFQSWINTGLIHSSLNAEYLEWTETGIAFTGLHHAQMQLDPETPLTIDYPSVSVADTWLSPHLLTFKNHPSKDTDAKPCRLNITQRDMLYALINNIVFLSTGEHPSRITRFELLQNSAYQEQIRDTIREEPVVAGFSHIPLCPWYEQSLFVNMVLALEQESLAPTNLSLSIENMLTIIAHHQNKALQAFSHINVWEQAFTDEITALFSQYPRPKTKLEISAALPKVKTLCLLVPETRYLNEIWLASYIEIKKPHASDDELYQMVCELIRDWRAKPNKNVYLWTDALAHIDKTKTRSDALLKILLDWRVEGINSEVICNKKRCSVLHAITVQQLQKKSLDEYDIVLLDKLLTAGANPYLCNKDGWTPLMDIAAYGYLAQALAFMNKEVYAGFRDAGGGWTALHYAAGVRQDEQITIQMLQILMLTTPIDVRDHQGTTPIMTLLPKKVTAASFAISRLGANPMAVNKAGVSVANHGIEVEMIPFIDESDFSGCVINIAEQLTALQKIIKKYTTSIPTATPHSRRMATPSDLPTQAHFSSIIKLLSFLHAMQHPGAISPPRFLSPEYPGYDVIHHADEQAGWNCFDVAVRSERRDIVAFALAHSHDERIRELLAPEIMGALALTATHLNFSADAAPDVDDSKDADTGRPIKKISRSREASYLLPECMHTREITAVFQQYISVDERPPVKDAWRSLNTTVGRVEGNYLNWDEIGTFFKIEANRIAYPEATALYELTIQTHFEPAVDALKNLCARQDIYEQYVREYYGRNEWFAFNARFESELHTTSMIDIVALMLQKTIYIHQPNGRVYKTAELPEGEMHVGYNGHSHFVELRAKPTAAPQASPGLSQALATFGLCQSPSPSPTKKDDGAVVPVFTP